MPAAVTPLRKAQDKPTARSEFPTALELAIWTGNNTLVADLLAAGADPNTLTRTGDPVLHLALRLGRIDIARAIINAGANLLLRDSNAGPTMVRVSMFADADREFARSCFRRFEQQTLLELQNRLAFLVRSEAGACCHAILCDLIFAACLTRTCNALQARSLPDIPDFQLRFTFNFHTWVPLIGRFLPSDVCTLTKVS